MISHITVPVPRDIWNCVYLQSHANDRDEQIALGRFGDSVHQTAVGSSILPGVRYWGAVAGEVMENWADTFFGERLAYRPHWCLHAALVGHRVLLRAGFLGGNDWDGYIEEDLEKAWGDEVLWVLKDSANEVWAHVWHEQLGTGIILKHGDTELAAVKFRRTAPRGGHMSRRRATGLKRRKITRDEAMRLVERVHPKYRPVWDGRPPDEQAALALYFLPYFSKKGTLSPTRSHALAWYCPFADQRLFPTGHRYCINVYTGCSHGCLYCYAAGYLPSWSAAKRKHNFRAKLECDLHELDEFNVPPAPVHLSNSTDPLQPLEEEAGDTRYALEHILGSRGRFTTVTILTKNPLLAAGASYMPLLKGLSVLSPDHPKAAEFASSGLPGLIVEVSIALWRKEVRSFYEPGAPPVEERLEGARALSQAGIPVVLRIDPLFPGPDCAGADGAYEAHGIDMPQTVEDLGRLAVFAKEISVRHIVYSVAKIVQPMRRKMGAEMQAMKRIYSSLAAPGRLVFRGGSFRLSEAAQENIRGPFLDICHRVGLQAKHCGKNLLDTR